MKRTIFFSMLAALLFAWVLAGCSANAPDAPVILETQLDIPVTLGALGNSLASGFINGGLIESGQVGSFPNLIAQNMGITDFAQPIVGAPGLGPLGTPLFVDEHGVITSSEAPDPTTVLRNPFHPVPYDNMGVPGATTSDVLNAFDSGTSTGSANIFFNLVLRNADPRAPGLGLPPGGLTQLDQMLALRPTFLLLWLGANDILAGATGGNPEVGVNVTPLSLFESDFVAICDAITGGGLSRVVVANLPSVLSTPRFTTIPLTATVAPGVNLRWVMDEDTDGDADSVVVVLLTAPVSDPSVAPDYLPGGGSSIPSNQTITEAELALLEDLTEDYNDVILREASSRGWGHVDAYTELLALPGDPTDLASFIQLNRIFPWDGTQQNPFSAFSIDGVHPSEKGQARIANVFIRELNATFGLGIPAVDESGISNVTGFELAPGFAPPRGKNAIPFLDENAKHNLNAFTELSQPKQRLPFFSSN